MTDAQQSNQKQMTAFLVELTKMSSALQSVEKDVREIKTDLKDQYITRKEFEPVQRLVYGLVALVLVAVMGALIGVVLIR